MGGVEGANKRILLVDDDEDVRFLLADLFEQEGYQAYEAADGVEALAEMRKRRHDVVLCDFHMPHMDGLAFLAISRLTWPDTPVIIASCDPELTEGPVSREAVGAFACLAKPFDLDELLSVVGQAAELARSNLHHATSRR